MLRKNKRKAKYRDYFRDAASVAFIQKGKELSLQLYPYCRKCFTKLQFDILLEERKELPSSSDDEDFNFDTTHVYPAGIHHLTTFFLIM